MRSRWLWVVAVYCGSVGAAANWSPAADDFEHMRTGFVLTGMHERISCETCHFFYEDGNWSGIPTTEVCAECHSEMMGESAAEENLVNEYINKDKEIDILNHEMVRKNAELKEKSLLVEGYKELLASIEELVNNK